MSFSFRQSTSKFGQGLPIYFSNRNIFVVKPFTNISYGLLRTLARN